jgi:hypothetical protein
MVSNIDTPAFIILTILGLAISFWGKQLARIISSISFAAFLSYIMWIYTYRLWNSIAISVILTLVAIAIGITFGFLMFKVAISILFAYMISSIILPQKGVLFLLIVIVCTIIMYVISNYTISLLFAASGSIMVYKGVTTLGLNELVSFVLCVVIFVLGFYNQLKNKV